MQARYTPLNVGKMKTKRGVAF
ncbi:hypothetical protein SPHINGO391_350413 [Sphingomonas aurantiaca]|uniref:Uncharacterized protein n=1 Tax=Sphingomonas aurantiaca TaxID=185949 RepID=A0A5E7YBH3_9SPHN|nr:hypothetical protein SPHINGO391_350413 [Sphingomonas aurantiaca]